MRVLGSDTFTFRHLHMPCPACLLQGNILTAQEANEARTLCRFCTGATAYNSVTKTCAGTWPDGLAAQP
jgi:hypothetical protein